MKDIRPKQYYTNIDSCTKIFILLKSKWRTQFFYWELLYCSFKTILNGPFPKLQSTGTVNFDPWKPSTSLKTSIPTPTPTQKLKIGFWILNSQGISSTLISFRMIFKALQFALFGFKFQSLGSKVLKIPEFNLCIAK